MEKEFKTFHDMQYDLPVKAWHLGHEHCREIRQFDKCVKTQGRFKYPNVIQYKTDDFCQRHQIKFNSELHKLPSGKEINIGCPICYKNDKLFEQVKQFTNDMQTMGMRLNQDTETWFMPQEVSAFENSKKNKKYEKDYKSKAYDDD